jgi:protein O-GlcNAc transferase
MVSTAVSELQGTPSACPPASGKSRVHDAHETDQAMATYRRDAERSRDPALTWTQASETLRAGGHLAQAVSAARSALTKNPWLGEAHLSEGAALLLDGQLEGAVVSLFVAMLFPSSRPGARTQLQGALARPHGDPVPLTLVRTLLRAPNDVSTYLRLARHERDAGRPATAIVCFARALDLMPDAEAGRDIALLLWDQGHMAQATERLVAALEQDDRHVGGFRVLGTWLAKQDPNKFPSPRWKNLVERCPDDVTSLVNLGAAAQRRGYTVEAARLHRRAIGLDPCCLEAQLNLGSALSDQGLAGEAIEVYRQALAASPKSWPLFSNLLFSMHLDPTQTREAIFAEHVEFGRRLCASTRAAPSAFPQSADPNRRLRIGYVSPDFRNHPVAHFIEPVLREHDREGVEVFCYSDVEYPDSFTEHLSKLVPSFTPTTGLRHGALFERIRADQIDILVDLAGHTGRNRLPVFAARPSPVQVSWIGYFDTTGLGTIDYRIADEHSVTPEDEPYFVERVVRLPRTANCYLPPSGPAPAPAPCLANGHVTFGCFNNPMKVGREVVAVFGEVLRRVPNSHLLFKYSSFNDPHRRARYVSWLAEEGIAEERLKFEGPSGLPQFLASFSKIDIALDPFPYSGETTALHTLWMGVPLVVLGGSSLVERLASRVLSICGRREWITGSREDYVRVAVDLARDASRLDTLRRELRAGMLASPLLDHAGVTRELEAAYRGMWQRWCQAQTGGSIGTG